MRGRPAFTRRKNSHGNFYFLNVALNEKKKKKSCLYLFHEPYFWVEGDATLKIHDFVCVVKITISTITKENVCFDFH
jgi:hypothetical protein